MRPICTIRLAEDADLDAITWIGMAAFPYDPQWTYRYPYRAEFGDDHAIYTRRRYSQWLDLAKTSRCKILVAECPSLEDPATKRVVSMSIWRIPDENSSSDEDERHATSNHLAPPKPSAERRDAHPFHMMAYRVGSEFAQQRYFNTILGKDQLSLAQLATHPDYFNRGAASMLLDWGLAIARSKSWPISVFAGPMGYNLYLQKGFRQVVGVTVKVLDDDDILAFPGLVWNPPGAEEVERSTMTAIPELLVVFAPDSA